MIWRYYGEVFVLITASFLVGSLVAAVAVRLLVRQQAPARPAQPRDAKSKKKAKGTAEASEPSVPAAAGGDH